MVRTNRTEKENKQTSLTASTSVYKIGHTTYKVTLRFNLESPDALTDVVKRLILKNIENDSPAA
jgi:hypothetical protein